MTTNKIAIFGLGISGTSTANFYLAKNYDVYIDDDNPESVKKFKPPFKKSNIKKINYIDWPWQNLKFLVLSPGIPLKYPEAHNVVKLAKKNNLKIICDIECFFEEKDKNIKLIGVTGTNGKSTTTALINHVINKCGKKSQIGGNYGIPALDMDTQNIDYKIIEISSFQLDLLDKTFFDYSLLLNITPDHLARHGGYENYIEAKKRIFLGQNEESISVICTDQEITKKIYQEQNLKSKLINYETNNFAELNNINFDNLPGKHNLQNIIGAYIICKKMGLKESSIISAIHSFKGLEHRIEHVCKKENFTAINDSKATNADATKPALKTFDNIIWLAGGVKKEGGIESLNNYFGKIKYAIFYGEAKFDFQKTFEENGFNNFSSQDNLLKAINEARAFCKKNKNENYIVLFSPSCASFDEFKNFEERGKFFKENIK